MNVQSRKRLCASFREYVEALEDLVTNKWETGRRGSNWQGRDIGDNTRHALFQQSMDITSVTK